MTKPIKISLTVVLGVIGIGASTLWLAPADMPFWAEFAKWIPGILITVLAFLAAENSRQEAKSSREAGERAEQEARGGRETAERAEQAAREKGQ